ncbi:sulfatase-like hydrolase/transferase, partial [Planctomycetota bacterium]
MSKKNRSIILKRLILAGFLFGIVAPMWAAERSVTKPNILFIITDQQFADVMGCAGSPWVQTPAMDSLAERGVRFTRAYVNYPVCLPERYTL